MEIEHERYKKIPGGKENFFYINSDKLEEDLKWIEENKIKNLKLTQDEYKLKTIDPILEIKDVRYLDVFLENADLSKLNELKELENLGIGEEGCVVDVSDLSSLRELYLAYPKKIKGLNTLKALEKLIVVKADINFFEEDQFRNWGALIELALLSPKLPQSLSFLKFLQNLHELEIFNSRSKFSLEDLASIKDSLTTLKIGNCKKVV